jgi:hypothetical protein
LFFHCYIIPVFIKLYYISQQQDYDKLYPLSQKHLAFTVDTSDDDDGDDNILRVDESPIKSVSYHDNCVFSILIYYSIFISCFQGSIDGKEDALMTEGNKIAEEIKDDEMIAAYEVAMAAHTTSEKMKSSRIIETPEKRKSCADLPSQRAPDRKKPRYGTDSRLNTRRSYFVHINEAGSEADEIKREIFCNVLKTLLPTLKIGMSAMHFGCEMDFRGEIRYILGKGAKLADVAKNIYLSVEGFAKLQEAVPKILDHLQMVEEWRLACGVKGYHPKPTQPENIELETLKSGMITFVKLGVFDADRHGSVGIYTGTPEAAKMKFYDGKTGRGQCLRGENFVILANFLIPVMNEYLARYQVMLEQVFNKFDTTTEELRNINKWSFVEKTSK